MNHHLICKRLNQKEHKFISKSFQNSVNRAFWIRKRQIYFSLFLDTLKWQIIIFWVMILNWANNELYRLKCIPSGNGHILWVERFFSPNQQLRLNLIDRHCHQRIAAKENHSGDSIKYSFLWTYYIPLVNDSWTALRKLEKV